MHKAASVLEKCPHCCRGDSVPVFLSVLVAGASPDSIIGLSSLNGAPGTPSDDEDLPHHLPGIVSAGASPTGSPASSLWVSGVMALAEKDLPLVAPQSASHHKLLQRSLADSLDAIEAPKGPGERPLGAASPKLRSSFPTNTRLSAMLHIDSDEDEDRSGANDVSPVPLSPLLMNGEPPDVGGADEDEIFVEIPAEPEQLEPEALEGEEEEEEEAAGGSAAGLVLELGPGLDLEDVFSEVDEASFAEAALQNAFPEGDVHEDRRRPGEEPSSEMDSCSMATALQTVVSTSESCPVTLAAALVRTLPSVSAVCLFRASVDHCRHDQSISEPTELISGFKTSSFISFAGSLCQVEGHCSDNKSY